MRTLVALVACAVVIAVAAGCGRKQTVETPGREVTVEEGPGKTQITIEGEEGEGKIEVSGDEMSGTITTEEGTLQFGADATVSEKDLGIPFYPGAKAAQAGRMMPTGQEEEVLHAYFTTPDSVDEVKAFYQEKLPGARTPIEITSADSRSVQMVLEEEGLQKTVVISRGKGEGETHIALMRVETTD